MPLADAQAAVRQGGPDARARPAGRRRHHRRRGRHGDTGPLRGRYGGPRDLVVGMRVALSDGTLAKSGGKVIKNVAGYDIAKLFTGSFGTLGAIVEVSVRLHPLRARHHHGARRARRDPDELARGAAALAQLAARAPRARRPLGGGPRPRAGALRRRASPRPQAEAAEALLRARGPRHRDRRRRRVALGRAARRPARAARGEGVGPPDPPAGPAARPPTSSAASLVGRAALGLSWLRFEEPSAAAVERLRRGLHRRGAGPAGRPRRGPVGRDRPRRATR